MIGTLKIIPQKTQHGWEYTLREGGQVTLLRVGAVQTPAGQQPQSKASLIAAEIGKRLATACRQQGVPTEIDLLLVYEDRTDEDLGPCLLASFGGVRETRLL